MHKKLQVAWNNYIRQIVNMQEAVTACFWTTWRSDNYEGSF